MGFRYYREEDYEAVCDFLIELNRAEKACINWNWARFEWMYEHPEFDKSLIRSIGIWTDSDRVVGAAVYDMYFGEAFCAALPGYEALYPEILDYAWTHLRDENGLGIAIRADQSGMIAAAVKAGFVRAEQREIIMSLSTDRELEPELPTACALLSLIQSLSHMNSSGCCGRGLTTGTTVRNSKSRNATSNITAGILICV